MSQSNVPDWLSWVVPVITAGGALWAAAKLLFVTRKELAEILEKSDKQREDRENQRHQENLGNFGEIFDRMGNVEKDVAYIRGQRSGR